MPARKPINLHIDDRHRARRDKRESGEDAAQPNKTLSTRPPAELDSQPLGQAAWRRLIRLYRSTEGTLITSFDRDALLEYCRGWADIEELRALRRKVLDSEAVDMDLLLKVDARMDRKGARLDSLRQQLYLTPRSRAGVIPSEKPSDDDPMESELRRMRILLSEGDDESS